MTSIYLQVLGRKARVPGDARQDASADLDAVVEGEDVLAPLGISQDAVGPGVPAWRCATGRRELRSLDRGGALISWGGPMIDSWQSFQVVMNA